MVDEHLNWGFKNPFEFGLKAQNEPIRAAVAKRIKLLITEHEHKQILEIGFGNGSEFERLHCFFKKTGCKYTGLDITHKFVKFAKKKYPEGTFLNGDCRRMRFKNKQFDLTFMFHVLEHQRNLSQLSEALLEIFRVTKQHVLIVWFLPPVLKKSSVFRTGNFFNWKWNYHQIMELLDLSDFKLKRIFWVNPKKNKCWLLEAIK
jgi:ubiquinone/menaquinone biosynthesis C-methylase UbiE